MNNILKENEAEIDNFIFVPHHPNMYRRVCICSCRKPNNKLIEDAIEYYNIDRETLYDRR